MNIIILNGPRHSGKDTACEYLQELFPEAIHCRFKDVLYNRSYTHFGIDKIRSLDKWIELCSHPSLKKLKSGYLNGLSPVEALIYTSEELIKKEQGILGVAKFTVEQIKKDHPDYENKLLIFSDGGFDYEVDYLLEAFNLTRDKLILIRLSREGCTYEGDSRSYIPNPDVILQNTTPSDFIAELDAFIDEKCGSVLGHHEFNFMIDPEAYADRIKHFNIN